MHIIDARCSDGSEKALTVRGEVLQKKISEYVLSRLWLPLR